MTIWNSKARLPLPVKRSRTKITVVSAVTISSTNITGFLISVAGLSFTKAWPIAGTTIWGSSNVATGIRLRILDVSIVLTPNGSERSARSHRQLLNDRPQRERGEEGETADDDDHADDESYKEGTRGRESAERDRD